MEPIDPSPRVGRFENGRIVDAFAADGLLGTTVDRTLEDGTWVLYPRGGPVREVLAAPDSARAKLWTIAAERELRLYRSPEVRQEASRWTRSPGIDDPSLEDLTHLPFITIDEPHSKDLDQAVYVESCSEGSKGSDGWVVWYAIADAAHFAGPDSVMGSTLFTESLDRGSTYYLPDLVFPMLPRSLSEGLVSINPNVLRRALVFRVELDSGGEVRHGRILRGRVRSHCKTSYEAVQAYYDGGPAPSEGMERGLEALRAVGEARMRRASERDVVQVQRREISVGIDDETGDGLRFLAMADPRYDSERYNEQISLLCNVVGARFLADGNDDPAQKHRIQGIFRFHTPPDEHRLDRLRRQIDAVVRHHARSPGGALQAQAETWSWRRGEESLADYLMRLPGPTLSEDSMVDDAVARLRRALHRQALLAGGRAGFAPVPGVHHGVGAEAYARFTAPMREVVGIFVHKETWEKLGLATPGAADDDQALRDRVMSAADRSRQLQRRLDHDTNRLVLDQLFGDDLARSEPPARPGTVLGIDRSKTYVQLDDLPIDVKIYHRHLAERLGRQVEPGFDGVSLRLGRRHYLALGDAVTLRVLGVDRGADRWQLELKP